MSGEIALLVATATQVFILNAGIPEIDPEPIYTGSDIRFALPTVEGHAVIVDGSELVVWRHGETHSHPTAIPEPIHCAVTLGEEPLTVILGTHDARLYRWEPGGDGAERIESFDGLEAREEWDTPWGGPPSVRSLAATPDGYIYADIHVGSIMRSADGGRSWEPVDSSIHRDVHQVATCPAAPSRVFANTANGVYVSEDHGNSWDYRSAGLQDRYGRAVAVHPGNPDHVIASTSRGPRGADVQARLYRSEDAGRTWTHQKEGFPESVSDNIDTYRLAFDGRGRAFAAIGESLYVCPKGDISWSKGWEAPGAIRMVCSP